MQSALCRPDVLSIRQAARDGVVSATFRKKTTSICAGCGAQRRGLRPPLPLPCSLADPCLEQQPRALLVLLERTDGIKDGRTHTMASLLGVLRGRNFCDIARYISAVSHCISHIPHIPPYLSRDIPKNVVQRRDSCLFRSASRGRPPAHAHSTSTSCCSRSGRCCGE